MSVRAYRVNKIDYESGESFNVTHDTELTDWLDNNTMGFWDRLNEDCAGELEFSLEELEEAVNHFTELDKVELVAELVKDIAWAKSKGDDYITYYCF